MSSPLASAVHDDACLLRRERHPDGHLAELDEPRARRLIVLEGLLHSSLCKCFRLSQAIGDQPDACFAVMWRSPAPMLCHYPDLHAA